MEWCAARWQPGLARHPRGRHTGVVMRILRLLSSRPLPCGCLAGLYETYDGPIACIVDALGADCHDPSHRPGARLRHGERGEASALPDRLPTQPGTR